MPIHCLTLLFFGLVHTCLANAETDNLSNAQWTITTAEQPLLAWQQETKTLQDIKREQLNHTLLNYLQTMPPQNSFVPLLKQLQQQSPIATIIEADHGHRVAAYPIAARASGLLNKWLAQDVSHETLWLLQQKNINFTALNTLINSQHAAIKSGFQLALQRLSPTQATHFIKQLLTTDNNISLKSLVGLQFSAPELIYPVIDNGHADDIINVITRLNQEPIGPMTEDILFQVAQRTGTPQKLAVSFLAPYSQQKTIAHWLMAQLSDSHIGRTAAFTLGKHLTAHQAQMLNQKYVHSNHPNVQKNILFALSRNAVGKQALKQLIANKSTHFDAQTSRWVNQILGANHES